MQPEQKASWLERMRQSARARGEQRLQRKLRPPWIWRYCPEGKRRSLTVVLTYLGALAYTLCILAALFGIIIAPLAIASGHRGSLLENAMRWYIHHFPKDADGPLYVITQTCIAGVLFYFVGIFDWLRKQKQHEKFTKTSQ